MREGKLERKKTIEKESVALKKLKEIMRREEDAKKDDKRYFGPLGHTHISDLDDEIIREDLQGENDGIYSLFLKGQFQAAREKVQEFKKVVESWKDGPKKLSNSEFLNWIDDKIEKAFAIAQNQEDIEKDNA